jgi:Flp pilus assembly protein TadG
MIMVHFLRNETRRPGATIPLFALLLVPLLGMLAFSVDIGYIALVATDLQTAADAAALAGAEKLQEFYVDYTLPNQLYKSAIVTTATTNVSGSPMETAKRFASYNKAGNVFIGLRDQDITFGFTDANGTYHSNYNGVGLGNGFPNSIKVIARRDGSANSPLSLFFGPVFGFKTKELTATATATIYSGDVTSLQAIPGVNAHILPLALDMNVWKTFYETGASPDGTTYFAPNGYPQLHVYPLAFGYPYSTETPGSFGLLDVGVDANNSPAFRRWIDEGETPNDIAYLIDNNLVPVSVSNPKNWKCGPGLKSTLVSDFQLQMGKPNVIPLFKPYRAPAPFVAIQNSDSYIAAKSQGQNATYAIVGFAGVTITQAEAQGSNMDISVQPYAIVDPTAVILNPRPSGTQSSQFGSSTIITTFISAKLTQ